jgi:hypothetical protein
MLGLGQQVRAALPSKGLMPYWWWHIAMRSFWRLQLQECIERVCQLLHV